MMMVFNSKVILTMKYSVFLVCTEAQMHCLIISQDDHRFFKRFIFVFVYHKMNSLHLLNKILSLLDLHFTIISFKYK